MHFHSLRAIPISPWAYFLELIILIICVFGQFALILNGVVLIRQDEFSFRAILKNTARQLRQLDPLGIFFLPAISY